MSMPVFGQIKFQSTPPVKAATLVFDFCSVGEVEISIHAAREGGDHNLELQAADLAISIHAAREGGDRRFTATLNEQTDFNPRRP